MNGNYIDRPKGKKKIIRMTFCALGKMEEAPVKMEEARVIIEIMSLGRGGLHRGIYNGN